MPLVVEADGSVTIDGTVDKGSEGIKKFQCRYNTKGVFIGARVL
jgi:hypothetical protein